MKGRQKGKISWNIQKFSGHYFVHYQTRSVPDNTDNT